MEFPIYVLEWAEEVVRASYKNERVEIMGRDGTLYNIHLKDEGVEIYNGITVDKTMNGLGYFNWVIQDPIVEISKTGVKRIPTAIVRGMERIFQWVNEFGTGERGDYPILVFYLGGSQWSYQVAGEAGEFFLYVKKDGKQVFLVEGAEHCVRYVKFPREVEEGGVDFDDENDTFKFYSS